MNVLVIAQHDNNTLNPATNKTLTCATALGDVTIAVFGNEQVASEAAQLADAHKVLNIALDADQAKLAAPLGRAIAHLANDYDAILMPSTTFGKDVLPRAAARCGCPQVSDLMEVIDARTFKRPTYAGNVIATVSLPEGVKLFATVRTASFKAADAANAACDIENLALDIELPTHTHFVELKQAKSERPDLQSAGKVVSGGRGVGSEENFKVIYEFADQLGAAVGASRAAVDAGFVPNELQVGQTGKIIAPDLYIAAGISGAIQHVTGIKDAGTIVAINKDPDAPIFDVADVGLVGDLFEVLPELQAQLK